MPAVTQILLFVSYAILGLAMMIVPPRLFGMDQQLAGFLGMFVFFGAWQLQNWIIAVRTEADSQKRLDHLEDVALILRKDLERTRREVESRGREGDAKNENLVSELKMLQTLLTQVSRKELELAKGSAEAVPEASEEEALELSIEHSPRARRSETEAADDVASEEAKRGEPEQAPDAAEPEDDHEEALEEAIEEFELTPEEAAMAVVDDGSKPIEELEAEQPGPAASEPAGQVARRGVPKPRRKAPIRLIKREDQLLKVVRSSLSENRVDLYLQPIVGLPSRRTVHYECFSRVRDEEGRIILPRQYLKVAENKGLIGTIDNLLLFRLIQLVRRLGKRQPNLRFFCNMSRFSMMDDEFFPQFIDFMSMNKEFAGRLVFEISQADFITLDGSVTERLQTLGRKGFGFSMDAVTDFNQDFSELEQYYFQFLKADLQPLMETHPEVGDVDVFKSSLRSKGMQLIASRIEDEEMVLQALDSGVELAQGYLFGEPTSANDMNREL